MTVLTWNVHDFFNDVKDSAAIDESVVTTADYQQHLARIAGVVKAMNPDIAILQEVENEAVVDDLNEALGKTYPYRTITNGNDPRGIDIAALSRISFDAVVAHTTDKFKLAGTQGPNYFYSRDCLELHLTYNARKIVLLGVHLKSKVMNDDGEKRLAEAQHTRAIADALTGADPSLLLAILGDFNDEPGSPPLVAADGASPNLYVDAAEALTADERYSYTFEGTRELIDHELDAPELRAMLDDKSVTIRHGADVDAASDHSPLLATYSIH